MVKLIILKFSICLKRAITFKKSNTIVHFWSQPKIHILCQTVFGCVHLVFDTTTMNKNNDILHASKMDHNYFEFYMLSLHFRLLMR